MYYLMTDVESKIFLKPEGYGFGFYYLTNSRVRFTFDIVRVQYSDLLSGNNLNVSADDVFNSTTGKDREQSIGRRIKRNGIRVPLTWFLI